MESTSKSVDTHTKEEQPPNTEQPTTTDPTTKPDVVPPKKED